MKPVATRSGWTGAALQAMVSGVLEFGHDPTVKAIPDGVRTLTPELICDGAAEAIAFYIKAFDAVEVMRFPGPDGKLMHAEIQIGDSTLRLMDAMKGTSGPKSLKGSPVVVNMQVEDADAVVKKAVAAGAKSRCH